MKTEILSTRVPARVIILNILQFIGIITAALAYPSPEMADLISGLPEFVTNHIGKIAVFLLSMKPMVNTIGDLLDNGRLDESWPPIPTIAIAALVVTFSGCAWYEAHRGQIGAVSRVALHHLGRDILYIGAAALADQADGKSDNSWRDSLAEGAYSLTPIVLSSGNIKEYLDAWNPDKPEINEEIAKAIERYFPPEEVAEALKDPEKAKEFARQLGIAIANNILATRPVEGN